MVAMLPLIILIFGGSVSAISCPKAVPYNFCSEYEVLHTTPPCCESTCDYDCCRVVCPKMLVYEPTCVCLEGYVRHQGECIPKTRCPVVASTPAPPCETSTKPCKTTTPPCVTTTPPCPTTAPACVTTPKPCKYVPPVVRKYSAATCVPPPPTPSYKTLPPYRYPPSNPMTTTASPPCTTTKPVPPCQTTTTPCPTTTTPCPMPPASCAACEQLVFTTSCCEPTCDFDCSDVACPLVLVEQATCACRTGLVRYEGHCIEPSACPKSASRYRLYVPVSAQCLQCNK